MTEVDELAEGMRVAQDAVDRWKTSDGAEPVFPEPVIVPLDELMKQMAMVPLEAIKKALALQGLYVIGPADLAVLKAMRDVPSWALENNDSDDYYCPQEMRPPIQAELIRRSILAGNSTIQRSGQ